MVRGAIGRAEWHRLGVKLVAPAAVGWTLASLIIMLLVPGVANGPGCLATVGGWSQTPECRAEVAAANDQIFALITLPLWILIGLGYAIVVGTAVARSRRTRLS